MKYLTGALCVILATLWSCGTPENKEQSTVDEQLKTEILANDSTASELEIIEDEVSTATEELDEALNELEIEQ